MVLRDEDVPVEGVDKELPEVVDTVVPEDDVPDVETELCVDELCVDVLWVDELLNVVRVWLREWLWLVVLRDDDVPVESVDEELPDVETVEPEDDVPDVETELCVDELCVAVVCDDEL